MIEWKRPFAVLVFLLVTGATVAQTVPLSNLRDRVITVTFPGQLLDTLTVVPHSLKLFAADGKALSESAYQLRGRYLRWTSPDLGPFVRAQYRVLPFNLDATAKLLDTAQLNSESDGLVIGGYDDYQRTGLLDNNGKVRTSGSFTRGISFGNSQSLVLNSAFNLQMSGELGNGIQISAAITDDNLPIQPEGTTQQLREFDRIFIQLRKGKTQLTAGDYELRNPDGYFLRYYKKLEGATFSTSTGKWSQRASVAVARGEFVRQNIRPLEGNQGPYKLTGDGASRFFAVLSGTERIFLDGELLVRGLDGDYVIDYNLAELTFTTRRIITRDSRITAEYEFSNQRYLRTLAAAGTRYDTEKFSAYVNVYTQQDSKTATGDQELTARQREALRLAGDGVGSIAVSSVDTLDGRAELRVTYRLTDTLIACPNAAPITEYLTEDSGGRNVATFTNRGFGAGTYELDPTRPANERVYRFVGVDSLTCQPLGSFEPVIDLLPPEQQRMLAVGGEYRFGEEAGGLRVEGSLSNRDRNRFSDVGEQNNNGRALRFDADRTISLGDSSGWRIGLRGQGEFVESTFRAINPFRSPEFYRNWNLSNRLSTTVPNFATERIFGGGVNLIRPEVGRLSYELERFLRGEDYAGTRQTGALALAARDWTLDAELDVLESKDSSGTGSFRRPAIAVGKRFKNLGGWTLSSGYRGEQSLRQLAATDSLSDLSFQFDKFQFGLASPENDRYRLAITASQRTDRLPRAEELTISTTAREMSAEGSYSPGKNFTLGGNFTFRDLDVPDRELADDEPKRTFLGRVDLNWFALERSLRSQTTYQVGSGQEPRVEFQYLYVGPGQGQYIWQDSLYNNDGRIQPNEMERAPFADVGDYVRVSVFTNDFIRTDNVGLNQNLNWDPARIWRGQKGFKKFLARFALNNGLIIDRKTRDSPDVQSWNPFQLAVADTSLTALNVSRRHGLFFNRANPKYDIQLSNNDRRNRRVLTTGYEESRELGWTANFRFRPGDHLSIEGSATTGSRESDSEFFNNKDFDIRFNRLEPSLNWQPKNWRLNTALVIGREENTLADGLGEATDRLELKLEGNFRRWLTARFRWIDIELDGNPNSPVGFALLQGLQPGRNLLWNVGATRAIGSYLQLTLSYEGRQTGESRTVHVGRAEVTAIF